MKNFTLRALTILCVLMLFVTSTSQAFGDTQDSDFLNTGIAIYFLDVGQGDCTIIQCEGMTLMIDTGDRQHASKVVDYLQKTLYIDHIDYLIVSHPHSDHIGGWREISKYCSLDYLYILKGYNKEAETRQEVTGIVNNGAVIVSPSTGDILNLGRATVCFTNPIKAYSSDNNNLSLISKLTYGNTTFLFPGDAGQEEEHDLMEAGVDLKSNVLHVPHHGAAESNEYRFIREVSPEYAIISAGKNNYKHPSEKTISVLKQAIGNDSRIFRTDMLGTVVCFSDGESIFFQKDATDRIEKIRYLSDVVNKGEQVGPRQQYTIDEVRHALSVVDKIKANGMKAPADYNPEKVFKNWDELLPGGVTYMEYDVNPLNGSGRDALRIVIGSDHSVWYTHNHYNSFLRLQ